MSFDIEKLYKENIERSAPDMDKLWGRIEAGLDAKEAGDSKTETITVHTEPARKIRWSRFIAVAACAVIVAAGAIVIISSQNKVKTDKSRNSASSYSSAQYNKRTAAADGYAEDKSKTNAADIAFEDKTAEQADNADVAYDHEVDGITKEEANTADAVSDEKTTDQRTPAATTGDNTGTSDSIMTPEEIAKKIRELVEELQAGEEYKNADMGKKAELMRALYESLKEEGLVLSYSVDDVAGDSICICDGFKVTVTL